MRLYDLSIDTSYRILPRLLRVWTLRILIVFDSTFHYCLCVIYRFIERVYLLRFRMMHMSRNAIYRSLGLEVNIRERLLWHPEVIHSDLNMLSLTNSMWTGMSKVKTAEAKTFRWKEDFMLFQPVQLVDWSRVVKKPYPICLSPNVINSRVPPVASSQPTYL